MKDKKTFLYKILWLPIVGVRKLFNCKIKNKELIGDDAIILAGTHTSIFDCLMLISCTKRPVHFLAKKELFTGFKALLFKNMGLIPVDRSKKDRSSIDSALEYLKKYSDKNQIIMFTCHKYISDTAKNLGATIQNMK